MASFTSSRAVPQPKRSFREILKSYFYWTYSRGSVPYDIMVTLILLFIFITPRLWNYGAKPTPLTGPMHPILVSGNGGHGVIVTIEASDVQIPPGGSESAVKQALRSAIEPVTGDAVIIERWETVTDPRGQPAWRVWTHR
jgi:hypothetical protein